MHRIKTTFSLSLVIISMIAGLTVAANAQRRNDRDIRDAVRSLDSKIEDFEYNLRYQMQSNSTGNGQISEVSDDIRGLRDALRKFQDNFDRKRENRDDVNAIVDAARRIESFMQAGSHNRRVQDDWDSVKKQIDRLGANYGITNNWSTEDEPMYPKDDRGPLLKKGTVSVGLSGTYELDSARSENIDDIVKDTSLGNEQREDLKDKLTAPQQIAINIRGTQITLATSNSSPVTFTADGRDKTEQSTSGKMVRLRATLYGDTLTVSSLGGETDYTIKFTSVSDGKGMKVVRRITTEYLNQTVIAESVYNKTDSVAQLGIDKSPDPPQYENSDSTTTTNRGNTNDPNGGYSDNDQNSQVSNGSNGSGNSSGSNRNNPNRRYPSVARPGNYVVPNGVILSGVLVNEINTGVSQNNDRFRMTVQSPDEFRGAVVEGYISEVVRSGKVSGQAAVTFNFEKITLRSGQTYDFAASLQDVRPTDGKTLKIDNESTVRGDSQTRESVKRGTIGGGIGAVIGAIAGGAKGAAIGAVIGAGGGAGTVAIQGKNDVRLQQGSTITAQSSSPGQRDR